MKTEQHEIMSTAMCLTSVINNITPFKDYCCHTGTAMMHPVPDRVKPSFVIFDIWAL